MGPLWPAPVPLPLLVVLIEKESDLGMGYSGHSGIVHAGYDPLPTATKPPVCAATG